MDIGSLIDFARIKPLAAWSLSAAALGGALAFFLAEGGAINWLPMSAAMICVVLMQYVSHPLNDLFDRELDARAAIRSTGRKKPLVDGSVSEREAKMMSGAIIVVILVIMTYLIAALPLLIIPAAYGMVALLGYSDSTLRLSRRPFTELYLGVPVNAIAVLVIAYVGAGHLNVTSAAVSLSFGFAAATAFVSMMSMDYPSDRADGKVTTVVRFPRCRWCALFPLLGFCAVIITLPWAASSLTLSAVAIYLAMSASAFGYLMLTGQTADRLRLNHLDGRLDDLPRRSDDVRLKQLYTSVAYAAGLTALFIHQGV